MPVKLEGSSPLPEEMRVKIEGAASCEEDLDGEEAQQDQEEEEEDDDEEEDREEDEEEEALGEPQLQQTAAYIKTYSKYGYRFMQLTQDAYNLRDDPEIMAMLEQQQLTGLVEAIACKIDEERCAEFMRTFNFFTKTGTVTGPHGEDRQVTICADLISKALHIPNRGRETQLKNTSKYFKHVVAPGYKATCDGVKFEDIVDPHVQRKARFLQMLTVCTYRNRHSRILKTNLARICAPTELHNWAALIATDLAAGCRNLNNRNCVCGSILTRVIHTQLGMPSEPYIDAKPLAQISPGKSSPELFSQVCKRKIGFFSEESSEKISRITKESDFQGRKGFMENGSERHANKDMTLGKKLCMMDLQNPEPIRQQQAAVEHPSSSSFLSGKNEAQNNTQATHSSSTLSIRSGDVVMKDTLTTGESQRKVTKEPSSDPEDYQGDCRHPEMENGPSLPSPFTQDVIPKRQESMRVTPVQEERAKGPKKTPEFGVLKLNQNAKLSKTNQQTDMGSRSFMAEEGKVPEPVFTPAQHILQEAVQEGTGSSQEKRTSFRASYPWYPTEHISHSMAGQNLWHGAEKALWDQSFALMNRLRAAQEADQQRLEEAERRAQNSMQRSINLEQAYQALELQMKIQRTQFEALEMQHSKLLKDQASLKDRIKECNLQTQCAQAERDKAVKSLKVKEAHIQALEKDLRRFEQVSDKNDQELNAGLYRAHDVVELEKKFEEREVKATQLQVKLDVALGELESRKLQLKEARGENAKLREQTAQLEAALQEKEFDLNSFRSDAEALLPDLEKLTKKYQNYKRSRHTAEW